MMHSFFSFLNTIILAKPVYAHCDIPCGIYDPHAAQLAAHTVIRMTQLIEEVNASSDNAPFEERKRIIHKITRATKTKEEHAELCKREISILWGDYFKPDHKEQYPELHDLVWKALKAASKTKQEISMEAADELLSCVQQIAEIFWKTKGVETVRGKSLYPTEREMVYPKI